MKLSVKPLLKVSLQSSGFVNQRQILNGDNLTFALWLGMTEDELQMRENLESGNIK